MALRIFALKMAHGSSQGQNLALAALLRSRFSQLRKLTPPPQCPVCRECGRCKANLTQQQARPLSTPSPAPCSVHSPF